MKEPRQPSVPVRLMKYAKKTKLTPRQMELTPKLVLYQVKQYYFTNYLAGIYETLVHTY